jgi:hypothetical protein
VSCCLRGSKNLHAPAFVFTISLCKILKVTNDPRSYQLTNQTYTDLVHQTFNFPQEDFHLQNGYLQFNHLDLKALIDKYGTPMKLTYLPKIGMQIKKAKKLLKSTGTKANIFIVTVLRVVTFHL